MKSLSLYEYKKMVFEELKEYGIFAKPDAEAQAYLCSEEVQEAIEQDYKKGNSVATCAWGIDLLY